MSVQCAAQHGRDRFAYQSPVRRHLLPEPGGPQLIAWTTTPAQFLERVGYVEPPDRLPPVDPLTEQLANVRTGDVLDRIAREYQSAVHDIDDWDVA